MSERFTAAVTDATILVNAPSFYARVAINLIVIRFFVCMAYWVFLFM
jgi:hypothetical protein